MIVRSRAPPAGTLAAHQCGSRQLRPALPPSALRFAPRHRIRPARAQCREKGGKRRSICANADHAGGVIVLSRRERRSRGRGRGSVAPGAIGPDAGHECRGGRARYDRRPSAGLAAIHYIMAPLPHLHGSRRPLDQHRPERASAARVQRRVGTACDRQHAATRGERARARCVRRVPVPRPARAAAQHRKPAAAVTAAVRQLLDPTGRDYLQRITVPACDSRK